jgi:hypothetical protein
MKSTTEVSFTGSEKSFLLSASSNGIFIDLFSLNGWLLQIFVVDVLMKHKSLIDSLVLIYPIVMVLELCALTLLALVPYRKLLFISFALRSLFAIALLILAYLEVLPELVPVFYYLGFFFHIAGFHVCWPLLVKNTVPSHRRGYVLGLARAYTNLLSLSALFIIFLIGNSAPELAAPVGFTIAVLASVLALTGLHRRDDGRPTVSLCVEAKRQPQALLKDFVASLSRFANDATFRKVAAETLAMALLTLPLPLLFLPRTGLITNAEIIFAFITGMILSISIYPAFGKLMDRSQVKAYRLVLAVGFASMLSIAAILTLQRTVSSYFALTASFLVIASNFVAVRLAGVFCYKRSLELTEPRLTAFSAVMVSWIFDLGVWSVVTAMQFLPRFEAVREISPNYALICFVSAVLSGVFFIIARHQQAPQHA